MNSLRILLTNNTLAHRAGSELVTRDLALGLLRRGHTPIAYSTHLGDVAAELRAATVPVIDQLSTLTSAPDIIHGQHHLDTMTALLHFPDTPAIYYCHGWLPWQEAPPLFPRIYRYLAVDETCRDRVLFENSIHPEQVRLLLNGVPLDRFRLRAPLPPRPQRALVFSNYAGHFSAIQEACARHGIPVDVVGASHGTGVTSPEEILHRYDLVFAKGRAALEALVSGLAVILCDAVGAGEMVTGDNWERLRPLNFGVRLLQHPLTAGHLADQIGRYNAADARQVSESLRRTAGIDNVVDELLRVYGEVITMHGLRQEVDHATESRAAAQYLRGIAPRVKLTD